MKLAGFIIGVLCVATVTARAQLKTIIDHNPSAIATSAFRFKNVRSPAKDDAAAGAKLLLIEGEIDPNAADLNALIDGALPTSGDQPSANLFFSAGTGGGRFRMDMGSVIEVAQINSYSWHPNTRGPQVYRVWGSDGSDPKFDPAPKTKLDPASCGWKLIATVDTRFDGDDGGQIGVSLSDTRASLGRYRYLLFDCYVTEVADNFGNTFYSEIDVVIKK